MVIFKLYKVKVVANLTLMQHFWHLVPIFTFHLLKMLTDKRTCSWLPSGPYGVGKLLGFSSLLLKLF